MIGKRITTSLLQSPFHNVVGQNKMLLTYPGQQSGKEHTIPVDYYQVADRRLLIFAERKSEWWKNLRDIEDDVHVLIRKQKRDGRPQVIEDVKSVAQLMQLVLINVPQEAHTFGLDLDERGLPRTSEISMAAWDHVAIYIKLYRVLKLVDGELVEASLPT